jgi:hypothetical protein
MFDLPKSTPEMSPQIHIVSESIAIYGKGRSVNEALSEAVQNLRAYLASRQKPSAETAKG